MYINLLIFAVMSVRVSQNKSEYLKTQRDLSLYKIFQGKKTGGVGPLEGSE